MIDEGKINYGLRPFKANARAFIGVRAIFERGQVEFVRGRNSHQGTEEDISKLSTWIVKKAMPALYKHIKAFSWTTSTAELFTFTSDKFLFEASPNGSYGYMYISAYIMED